MSFEQLNRQYAGYLGLFLHLQTGFSMGRSIQRMGGEARRWIERNIPEGADRREAWSRAEAYIAIKTEEREEEALRQTEMEG